MGGGWRLVSREVAVDMLQYIFGLSEEQSGGLYDTFVSKYGRKPTITEVKVGLGYTGDDITRCRISDKSTTYKAKNSYYITAVKSDGELCGMKAVKQGDGWKYTCLTEDQLPQQAV